MPPRTIWQSRGLLEQQAEAAKRSKRSASMPPQDHACSLRDKALQDAPFKLNVVNAISGSEMCTIDAQYGWNIRDLQGAIADSTGILAHQQQLVLGSDRILHGMEKEVLSSVLNIREYQESTAVIRLVRR